MMPVTGTFIVEVMVGVPLAEIATGTLVLLYVAQLLVANENEEEKLPLPHWLLGFTLQ